MVDFLNTYLYGFHSQRGNSRIELYNLLDGEHFQWLYTYLGHIQQCLQIIKYQVSKLIKLCITNLVIPLLSLKMVCVHGVNQFHHS